MPKRKVLPKKSQAVPIPGGGVRFDLGGKSRVLRFDFNALCAVEEATGINALDGEVWVAPTAKTARALLWASLLHEDPGLTIQEVGSWLTPHNFQSVADALASAYGAAMGGGEEQGEQGSEGEEKN